MASADWIGSGSETAESEAFLGLNESDALASAEERDIVKVRLLDEGRRSYTMENDPERLTMLLKGNLVAAAGFF